MEKYINPFTDFGFKKIFGEEANKDLLIDFLNQLIDDRGQITDLIYLKNEHIGATPEDRKAVFDLYCETDRGEKFIVELQKARQKYFKDRSLYYSTFAIQEQAVVGDWNFKLQPVYTIAILDFVLDDDSIDPDHFIHDIRLTDIVTKRVFNPKLRYLYLEMPKFTKQEHELETHFEKWLYILKNLARLQDVPARIQERIFTRLFQVAEIARYSQTERYAYHDSLKYYRDIKNITDTAWEEGMQAGMQQGLEAGLQQGLQQGRQEAARKLAQAMSRKGFDIQAIIDLTGLSAGEIQKLLP